MLQLRTIPGRPERDRPLVAVGVLTRDRPDRLAKALTGIRRSRTGGADLHVMVWNNGTERVDGQTHGVGYNVGQHVSMNRMIDEAVLAGADWFVRVDDDCVFETRDWIADMMRLQRTHTKRYGIPCVLGPYVHGLRCQIKPISMTDIMVGKYRCQLVPILGGICRMMPMSLLRYWRFDERMPMGFSEADNFARFCAMRHVPMLRCMNVEVNHGGTTEDQEKADPAWAYEHDMLQFVPFGL